MNSLLAKAKPILFSTEMVKAILEGRKTMTRRVVKPQIIYRPEHPTHKIRKPVSEGNVSAYDYFDFNSYIKTNAKYHPGDILYVRETTYLYGKWVKNGLTKTGKQKYKFVWDKTKSVIYTANSTPDSICTKHNQIGYFKRPSIFMPKEAARLFLKVKDVRVERLQDISEDDRLAEGENAYCPYQHIVYGGESRNMGPIGMCYSEGNCSAPAPFCEMDGGEFRYIWDSLNAKRGYGWDTNPWVFVYEFERIEV